MVRFLILIVYSDVVLLLFIFLNCCMFYYCALQNLIFSPSCMLNIDHQLAPVGCLEITNKLQQPSVDLMAAAGLVRKDSSMFGSSFSASMTRMMIIVRRTS